MVSSLLQIILKQKSDISHSDFSMKRLKPSPFFSEVQILKSSGNYKMKGVIIYFYWINLMQLNIKKQISQCKKKGGGRRSK